MSSRKMDDGDGCKPPADSSEPQKREQKEEQFRDKSGPEDLTRKLRTPPPISRHHNYTIAWICALPIELAAARAMLDEVHNAIPTDVGDSNTYTLGRIGQHNIAIACLPITQYGTINAANVVTNLTRTFPSIRAGLMVGIGGGVPSKADVRLSDVVVGIRVMQYDMGKTVGDGQVQRTCIPKIPHQLLGTALSMLHSIHILEPNQILLNIQKKLGGYPDYSRPDSTDRLFQATYDHESETDNCETCDPSKVVQRRTRTSDEVMIHYGAIASGNQVMKNGVVRDNIAQEMDVLCFEMEAAGLMDTLPCLVIRGVCDYSDSHKNKEWQKFAVATSAAYAREFLEILPETKSNIAINRRPFLGKLDL